MLGSRENFYRLVCEEGYFLPALSSRAITNEYLRGVLSGTFQQLRSNELRQPPKMKKEMSKIDMLTFIQEVVGGNRELGFGPGNMPDTDYFIAICYSLNQDLEMFTGVQMNEQVVRIPVSFLDRIKFFDPYLKN